jgi:CheY-like chemotaxis protein
VRSFLSIARQRKVEKRAFALAPLLDSSIELLLYSLRSAGITIAREYDESLPDVFADPDQVQQVVVNLLANAAQALDTIDGPREIRVSAVPGPAGKLTLVIADNGPGVPEEIAQRIFEPFFTTKPQGSGTGIGLSVSRGLAQAQGGDLGLIDSADGAAFAFMLPISGAVDVADTAPEETPEVASTVAGRATRRVSVVDDAAAIAALVAEALAKAGYACDIATGGREAQAMIGAHPDHYDAIVCDLRMPDIDGPKLFDWLSTHHPTLAERTLFVTGDALGPVAGRFLAKSGRPVLEKPFPPAELVRIVSELSRLTGAKPRRRARRVPVI